MALHEDDAARTLPRRRVRSPCSTRSRSPESLARSRCRTPSGQYTTQASQSLQAPQLRQRCASARTASCPGGSTRPRRTSAKLAPANYAPAAGRPSAATCAGSDRGARPRSGELARVRRPPSSASGERVTRQRRVDAGEPPGRPLPMAAVTVPSPLAKSPPKKTGALASSRCSGPTVDLPQPSAGAKGRYLGRAPGAADRSAARRGRRRLSTGIGTRPARLVGLAQSHAAQTRTGPSGPSLQPHRRRQLVDGRRPPRAPPRPPRLWPASPRGCGGRRRAPRGRRDAERCARRPSAVLPPPTTTTCWPARSTRSASRGVEELQALRRRRLRLPSSSRERSACSPVATNTAV